MMSYTVRWRKAVFFSVFFHIFIGITVASMSVKQIVPPIDEQVIELNLTAFSSDEPVQSEPQSMPMSLPAPELESSPQEVSPSIDPLPNAKDDDITDSELVPIKAILKESDTSAAPVVVSNSRSGMGTPPVVLVRAEPVNPPEVNRIGRKITVVLRIQILTTGLPGKVEVAIPSGQKSINDAAIAAAKKWRFEPAKDSGGNPVVCSTILSIPFTPQ